MTDQVDPKDFLAEVKERYVQNPCQVSDLAFWKVAELCQECETHSVHKNRKTYLYAIRDKRLVFYWSDDRQHFLLTPNETKALEFLVLHKDFYKLITNRLTGYQVQESYPLLYDFTYSPAFDSSDEFYIADFDFSREQELFDAAKMLNRCYDKEHHNTAEVAGWSSLPVVDRSLWLWIKSRVDNEAVGLGISTYQASIRECYLDWIQVLPEYQGRGLGRLLVHETVKRAIDKSDIIRVTGKAEAFYRKCGFVGSESWRIISKI